MNEFLSVDKFIIRDTTFRTLTGFVFVSVVIGRTNKRLQETFMREHSLSDRYGPNIYFLSPISLYYP